MLWCVMLCYGVLCCIVVCCVMVCCVVVCCGALKKDLACKHASGKLAAIGLLDNLRLPS